MLEANEEEKKRGNMSELFRFPSSKLVLMDYAKGKNVSHLSSGWFHAHLIMQPNCPILATVCSVDDFKWPLSMDTVIFRMSLRTFAIALPGLLFGLQFLLPCPLVIIELLQLVFQKYAHFKDIYHHERGYPVDDNDPKIWRKLRPQFVGMAHEALRKLGHLAGGSRFSVENHNSCFLRACRMSAMIKLITESMLVNTMTSRLINIKGTNPPEAHQGRAYATVSTFTCLVDAAEYAWLVFCGLGDKVESVESPLRLPSSDIGYQVWSLNQEGLLVFMHRLGPATELEQKLLSEKVERKDPREISAARAKGLLELMRS
ncbi:hypothetical protein VNO77_43885 [Canavalia gladiata]|uniref:Uncharacterized protein n=1 Tax=Canavalia gladiata TaxID=3824 RepID=A0AAN9JXK3_CANGL